MRTIKLQAMFKGKMGSMGLETNRFYNIKLEERSEKETQRIGSKLRANVEVMNPDSGSRKEVLVDYTSFCSFLRNWSFVNYKGDE